MRVCLFAFLFLMVPASVSPSPADAVYIPERDYFSTLTTEISKARSSIVVAVYLFALYPSQSQAKTTQLAEALVAAKKRGVAVRIVLDKGESSADTAEDNVNANNHMAYEYLRSQGLDMCFADVPGVMHAKAVVIDSATVILGSANWSEAAFLRNTEISVMIRSREIAAKMLGDLGKIPAAIVRDNDTTAARLPVQFLKDTTYLGRMVTNRDERTFDVYLYLLKYGYFKPETTLVINYDTLARSLGIDTAKPATYRAMIYEICGKLRDKYRLIEYYSQSLPDVKIRIRALPGETMALPAGYFSWGWNRRLPFTAKVMAVLGMYYSSTSTFRPKWSLAVETIAKRHGFFKDFVWTGTLALRRANLESVEYSEVPQNGNESHQSNIYMPLPFYDPDALAAKWIRLEAKYGKEKTDQGRKYAELVFKDCDPVAVDKLITLENKFGIDKMEKAAKIIGAMEAYNPKRSIEYFIGIVRKSN